MVQLGAGCDTRALRLKCDVPFFEALNATKKEPPSSLTGGYATGGADAQEAGREVFDQFMSCFLVARWLRATQVAVDLRQPETLLPALLGAGFRAEWPSAWICEGLLEYNEANFATKLLKAMSQVPHQPFGESLLVESSESTKTRGSWCWRSWIPIGWTSWNRNTPSGPYG